VIPEIGQLALVLALVFALALAIVPQIGAATGRPLWMAASRPFAGAMLLFIALSFACLAYAFLTDDFSVAYVANNSKTLLPSYFKFSAIWGGHEGSLLLWVLILSLWTYAVALFSRTLPLIMVARVLSVMGMVSIGFLLFMLLTSNPFDRLLPFAPMEGRDLNPLLQDIGLIVHPPLLYTGYVGFSVAFAFAIAALQGRTFDQSWARWTRPWTNVAWAFLTAGIVLGSWWAYYELGWGGWWFWDPVENASFMPWLVGTALVHSLAVSEKRGLFRSWTLLLAIFTFSLSLLGTFLVRSGVLTSVHAFATDPERGVFILGFLGVVVGGSLLLFALRGPGRGVVTGYSWLSREMFLLLNNVLLVVITAMVLIGTLYPLLADVLGWGRISVGPPYFNLFFIPLTCVLVVVMAIGSVLRWKRNAGAALLKPIAIGDLVSTVAAVLVIALRMNEMSWGAVLAVALALWVVFWLALDVRSKTRNASGLAAGLRKLTPSFYAMWLGHLGIAMMVVGAAITTVYSEQRDVRLSAGDDVTVAGYRAVFNGVRDVAGPNYAAQMGELEIYKGERRIAVMHPEKRRYFAGGNVMTEVALHGRFWRDIYIALGEELGDGAWAVRVYVKPVVRWIWIGGFLVMFAALLSVFDKRYRRQKPVPETEAAVIARVAEST